MRSSAERPDHDRQSLQRLGPHPGDSRQAREASDLAAARAGEIGARRRAMLVGTGVACVTKDYGTGADCSLGRGRNRLRDGRITIHCDHVEMGNGIGTALANRVAIHLGGVADEVAVARVDTYDAARAGHLGRFLHDGPEDPGRRGEKSALGAGDQFGHQSPRSARMSAPMRRPRPRASSSASACGRRRWNCGASRRPIRAPRNGRRRTGRTGSSSCPGLRRCRCRRSPQERMRATS